MKIKVAFLVFLSLFLFTHAHAQKKGFYDVVYLKNGSVVRGMITEFVPDESVKIETRDKSIFIFLMHDVEKITWNNPSSEKKTYDPVIKKSGYFNETETGLMLGKKSTGKYAADLSVHTVHGYQINRHVRVGCGTGVDHYAEYGNTFVPVFGSISGDIIKYWITPFYSAHAGYGFLVEKDTYAGETRDNSFKGGWLVQSGLGVRFYTPAKISLSLIFAIKLQYSQRSYTYDYAPETLYREERLYRRYAVRLGMHF
ncbi:MAG: hypothetical protein KatS3mg031_2209 [Chitinophagales bacterium]|nr:MAG: hypothetical protein KatS3mg031_2209 [Chitinophagales bacterium]